MLASHNNEQLPNLLTNEQMDELAETISYNFNNVKLSQSEFILDLVKHNLRQNTIVRISDPNNKVENPEVPCQDSDWGKPIY